SSCVAHLRRLSSPTRRSSDLAKGLSVSFSMRESLWPQCCVLSCLLYRKKDSLAIHSTSCTCFWLSRIQPSQVLLYFPQKCRNVRSEEHTSELQSLRHLVCRLL